MILYTTHCPKCKVLEKKLKSKNIEYTIEDNVDKMIKLGFSAAPVLEVDGQYLDFSQAVKYVNEV